MRNVRITVAGIPAVVLERRADFLVQRIELTNDTRSADRLPVGQALLMHVMSSGFLLTA